MRRILLLSFLLVQGQALDQHAKKDVKVIVVGNPANTNALVCSHYAPSIPKENFSAMTRLDQNRAYAQLALKAGVPISEVKNAIIWGNHSSTQFPDAAHATIGGKPAKEVGWLENASFEKLNLECESFAHKCKIFT